jgi:hypothetical protein
MNRRSFLKAFTGAAVGAGVLANGPKVVSIDPIIWGDSPVYKALDLQKYINEMSRQISELMYADPLILTASLKSGAEPTPSEERMLAITNAAINSWNEILNDKTIWKGIRS